MKALEMLKKAYFSPLEFTKEDYEEAITEIEAMQKPNTCDGCVYSISTTKTFVHNNSICCQCDREPYRKDFFTSKAQQ